MRFLTKFVYKINCSINIKILLCDITLHVTVFLLFILCFKDSKECNYWLCAFKKSILVSLWKYFYVTLYHLNIWFYVWEIFFFGLIRSRPGECATFLDIKLFDCYCLSLLLLLLLLKKTEFFFFFKNNFFFCFLTNKSGK